MCIWQNIGFSTWLLAQPTQPYISLFDYPCPVGAMVLLSYQWTRIFLLIFFRKSACSDSDGISAANRCMNSSTPVHRLAIFLTRMPENGPMCGLSIFSAVRSIGAVNGRDEPVRREEEGIDTDLKSADPCQEPDEGLR